MEYGGGVSGCTTPLLSNGRTLWALLLWEQNNCVCGKDKEGVKEYFLHFNNMIDMEESL